MFHGHPYLEQEKRRARYTAEDDERRRVRNLIYQQAQRTDNPEVEAALANLDRAVQQGWYRFIP